MEELTGFFGALILALIIGAIFYYGLKRRGPWAFWVFLLILFFAAWAGSFWIEPVGPLFWGFAWLPLFFWVFILALAISAAGENRTKSRYDRTSVETGKAELSENEAGAATALGFFFWFLLGLLIAAVIIGLLT